MNRKLLAAVVVLVLVAGLAAAVALWSRDGRPAADASAIPISGIDSAVADHAALDVDDLSTAPGWSPIPLPTDQAPDNGWPTLPALGTPVAEIFTELERRGRQGDASAACRLATELMRCLKADFFTRAAEDAEHDAARGNRTPQQAIDYIARAQSMSEAHRTGCEGLSSEQLASTFDWQRHAAMLDPSLRRDFAILPALNPRDFLADLDRWAEYRRLALPWLVEAARNGDVPAVIALSRIYGDRRAHTMPSPPFRIPDDLNFVVYAELMERYGAGVDIVRRMAAQARGRLTPSQLAQVERRVDQLFDPGVPKLDAAAAGRAMGSSLRSDFSPENCGPADTAPGASGS